jgi:hypothetical protein
VSKEKARGLQEKQETIGKIGKRIQLLMKKPPSEALILAKAIYKKFGPSDLASDDLVNTVKSFEKQMGPHVPRLNMNDTTQNASIRNKGQGRGQLWTTEGGVLVQEQTSRAIDGTARHEALRTKRRARQTAREQQEQRRRVNAKQKQRQFSKLAVLDEERRQDESDSTCNEARTRRFRALQEKKNNVWYRQAQHEAELEQKAKQDKARLGREEMRQTKEVLQAQMKQREDAAGQLQAERKAYEENVLRDVEQHKRDQLRKFREEAARNKTAADAQLEQRLERRRGREKEAVLKERDDRALLRNIEVQQEKDRQKEAAQLAGRKEQMRRVKEENAQQMSRTRDQAAAEKRKDKALALEYEQLEARREAQRVAKLEKMRSDVQAKMARFDHLQQEEDKVARANEARAAAEEKRMAAKAKVEERRKKLRKDTALKEQQQVLRAQVESKKARQEAERAEDRLHAREWQKEGDAMDAREAAIARRKQVAVKSQQHWLTQQVDTKRRMEEESDIMGMDQRELALNRHLLQRLGCEVPSGGSSSIADQTRTRAQQVEDQQKAREQRMMMGPAGMPSHRGRGKGY